MKETIVNYISDFKDAIVNFINDHQFNHVDGTAMGVGILSLFKYLPEISAGLSAVWVALRIYVLIRDEIINRKGT